ncbi:MAG TPA: ABC transporter permease [Alphaproteobacteria bacterium]|nr:ABC transporter permease [Alphaproteobacteria bacterium]
MSPLLAWISAALMAAGLALPIGYYEEDYAYWSQFPVAAIFVAFGIAAVIAGERWLRHLAKGEIWAWLSPIAVVIAGIGPAILPTAELSMGLSAPGFWFTVVGVLLFAWTVMQHISALPGSRIYALVVPALFGVALVYLWQSGVVGFAVPRVLLPAPTEILDALGREAATLADDFRQTFLKAVLAGFFLGNLLGLGTALLVDRVPFLQRGLLPLGNLVSAVPIIGVAPIMVIWFGFGWESKTAVIVFMIFFPMLVNALTGLNTADRMQLDLMRSYGASYWQTLFALRLPAALPFVFNALKINSTLALIGGIVAEFFGSGTSGMGFRISTQSQIMNVDVVWATIAVAALVGSASYGMLAVLERSFTFWHPSYRSR